MTAAKLATLLMLTLLPPCSGKAAEANTAPVEIVITGRQPGPPLWKVSNGDKVLWIFPHLGWIPKDMIWDNGRVARIIAQSQEALGLPQWHWVPPRSALLNPVNVARNLRNGQRAERNPAGGNLEENLPPQLFARFVTLKTRYFPGNDEPLEMRPLAAGRTMLNSIRKQEGLVTGDDILETIQHLVRNNRTIERTEISVREALGSNFGEYSNRLGAVWASFPPVLEQTCFEQQVRLMEEDLGAIKRRASNWAQGDINEFRYAEEFRKAPQWLWEFDELDACAELFMGSSSPEHEALVGLVARVNQMWLDAAENGLATNASTFAILPINELVAEDGLLSKLKAKGYEVREPPGR